MSLELLLIVAFGGAFLTYFLGKISGTFLKVLAVIISLSVIPIIAYFYGNNIESGFFHFFELELTLRVNSLSWLFAIAVSVLGALSIIFSLSYMKDRENKAFYYFMMLFVNASMLGVVLSGDLVSFFVFWEMMSWSTFLLISYNGGTALKAGLKYIIYSIIGSMAMLAGMMTLYVNFQTLNIAELAVLVSGASSGYILFLLVIFGIAFAIKNAVVPFHSWLPEAYSESPSAFTAVLSGMLTRMGVYGFLLIMYVIVGFTRTFSIGVVPFSFNYILAWLGAITIVIPTFIAMLQNDAKKLLAWHGIGQGGYMIVGIAYGTSLGLAGGIFHTLNHAIYIVLLFLSVAAVQYRTHERDLNSLGGLVKKMPVAFVGGLFGIFGLMGVPLTNGFVSKWLIYKTLIMEGSPLLAFAALVGTWGTILSVFKFLHNIFLGQLPEKYKDIKPAPLSMQIPILILAFTIVLFGVLPGIPLKVINSIIISFGMESLDINIWGIASETGTLNTVNIFAIVMVALLVVALFFKLGRKSRKTDQYDNYAAGAPIPKDRYGYTVNFYNPLYRMITPYLKDHADSLANGIAKITRGISDSIRKIYTGYVGNYIMYIVVFLAFLILIQLRWSVF
jgi:NADH-quinone oxidoreductase subunit M